MICVTRYRRKLEDRFLAANFVKLNQPVETEDVFAVGMDVDETVNFDMNYWEPAVITLLRAMTDTGIREFYRLDVYYDDGALWVTASRGDTNGRLP